MINHTVLTTGVAGCISTLYRLVLVLLQSRKAREYVSLKQYK